MNFWYFILGLSKDTQGHLSVSVDVTLLLLVRNRDQSICALLRGHIPIGGSNFQGVKKQKKKTTAMSQTVFLPKHLKSFP